MTGDHVRTFGEYSSNTRVAKAAWACRGRGSLSSTLSMAEVRISFPPNAGHTVFPWGPINTHWEGTWSRFRGADNEFSCPPCEANYGQV